MAFNKDYFKLAVGAVVLVALLGGLLAFMQFSSFNLLELAWIGLVLLIALGTVFVLRDRYKNIKAGLPTEDELSQRQSHKAGYYAYLVSVWTAVVMYYLHAAFPEVDFVYFIGVIVLVPGIVFIGLTLYWNRKGE